METGSGTDAVTNYLNWHLVEILERSRRFVRTENHDLLR